MVNKKEDNLLHTQGMYYEFDGIKFKSIEELEAYKKLRKNSEEEISEEKAVEDTKAESHKVKVVEMTDEAVENLKASIEAKKAKAKEKAEVDKVAKEKVEADRIAKEKRIAAAAKAERLRLMESAIIENRAAKEKAETDRVAKEKAEADKAKSNRESIKDIMRSGKANVKSDDRDKVQAKEVDGVTEEIAVSKKFYIRQYIWLIIFTIFWVGLVKGAFDIDFLSDSSNINISTLEALLFIIASNGFLPTLIIWVISTKIQKGLDWKWYHWLNTLAFVVLFFNWIIFLESLGGFFGWTNVIPSFLSSEMQNFINLGIGYR